MKGCHFLIEGTLNGILFLPKMVYKRVWVEVGAEPPSIKLCCVVFNQSKSRFVIENSISRSIYGQTNLTLQSSLNHPNGGGLFGLMFESDFGLGVPSNKILILSDTARVFSSINKHGMSSAQIFVSTTEAQKFK